MAISIEQARIALMKLIEAERTKTYIRDDELIELNNMYKKLADSNQSADEAVSQLVLGDIRAGYIVSNNFQKARHQLPFWIHLRSAAEAIIMDIDLNTVTNKSERNHFENAQREITEKKQLATNATPTTAVAPAASSLGLGK